MSDFILQNMMRASIESSIRSAGRDAARASDRVSGRVDAMSDALRFGMSQIRTDMLSGMGGIQSRIQSLTRRVDEGLYEISFQARQNNDLLRSLGMSVDTMSMNMVTGFGMTLDRLEGIQSTLDEIKSGVQNPDKTRALEAYRTARSIAERGRPTEALKYVTAAIENKNGLPMGHIPELRVLRGSLYMGIFDTPEETVANGLFARADLEEAFAFADAKAKPMINDYLATTLFAIQDFSGAKAIYEKMPRRTKTVDQTDFQIGRCMLSMGMVDAAKDIFSALLKKRMEFAVDFASDPVCAAYPDVFRDIFRKNRKDATSSINAVIASQGDRRAALFSYFSDMKRIFSIVSTAHRKAVAEAKETPESKELARLADQVEIADVKITYNFPTFQTTQFKERNREATTHISAFDKIIDESNAHLTVAPLAGDLPDWTEISKKFREIERLVNVNTRGFFHAWKATENSLKIFQDCEGIGWRKKADRVLCEVNISVTLNENYSPPKFREPSRPGFFGKMFGAQAEDPIKVAVMRSEHKWKSEQDAISRIMEPLNPLAQKVQDMIDKRTDEISRPLIEKIVSDYQKISAAGAENALNRGVLEDFSAQYDFAIRTPDATAPSADPSISPGM